MSTTPQHPKPLALGTNLTTETNIAQYFQLLARQAQLQPVLGAPVQHWQVTSVATIPVTVHQVLPVAEDGEPYSGWLLKTTSAPTPNPLSAEHRYHQTLAEAAQDLSELTPWASVPSVLSPCHTALVLPQPAGTPLRVLALTQSDTLTDGHVTTLVANQLGTLHRWGRNCRYTLHHNYPKNPYAQPFQHTIMLEAFDNAPALEQGWQATGNDAMELLQQRFLKEFESHLRPVAEDLLGQTAKDDWLTLTHGDFRGGNIVIAENQLALTPANPYYSGLAGGWLDLGMVISHLWLVAGATGIDLPTATMADTYWRTLTEAAPMLARNLDGRSDCMKKTSQLAGFEVIRRLLGSEPVDFITDTAQKETMLDAAAHRILSAQKRTEAEHLAQLAL